MSYPPLVRYGSEDDYRAHYEKVYCGGPIVTFDGIKVRFRKNRFKHSFSETVVAEDDTFSMKRAERIDWIRAALQDSSAELHQGWDKDRKRVDPSRRVAVVQGNYVVVIQMTGGRKADFITAYVAGASTIAKVRGMPEWA